MLALVLEEAWREASRVASDLAAGRAADLIALQGRAEHSVAGIAWGNPLVAAYVRDLCGCYLAGADLGCPASKTGRLHIRVQDASSPIPLGREATDILGDYELALFKDYRTRYNLTNAIRVHHTTCQFVRIGISDNHLPHGILRMSVRTAELLAGAVPAIRDSCRQGMGDQRRLETILDGLMEDADLRNSMDRAALQLESALFGTMAKVDDPRRVDRKDALKHLMFSLWFHLNRGQFRDYDLEAMWFPVAFGRNPSATAVVLLGFNRVLNTEQVYGSMQLWRNIIVPIAAVLNEGK